MVNSMRTVCRWRSTDLQSGPLIRAFGLRAVCKPFDAVMYMRLNEPNHKTNVRHSLICIYREHLDKSIELLSTWSTRRRKTYALTDFFVQNSVLNNFYLNFFFK